MSDETIRNLERQIQADPTDLNARIALFKEQIRLDPQKIVVSYKIRHKATGKYIASSSSYYKFSKKGKIWNSIDSLCKSLPKYHPDHLVNCEIVELQILESVPSQDLDFFVKQVKLASLAKQQAELDQKKLALEKEIEKLSSSPKK